MRTTSQLWGTLWAAGARLETVAVIDGTVYDSITAPVVTRALTQGGLTIGNAVSASCELTVRTDDEPPRSASVEIKTRLNDGIQQSEWLTQGTFYISHRSRDPVNGLLRLECYDTLMMANVPLPKLPWTDNNDNDIKTNGGSVIAFNPPWPLNAADWLVEIIALYGYEMDSRTDLSALSGVTIPDPGEGATVRDILGFIARICGGNWIITPDGKLRLVPIVSAAGAASAADALTVEGIVGGINAGPTSTITGVRYTTSDNVTKVVGSDTGIIIDAGVMTASQATALKNQLTGRTYQSFDIQGAVYDPRAELGDYVISRTDVAAVLYAETATYGPLYRGDIGAPDAGEVADEYPYQGPAAKSYDAIRLYAQQVAQSAAMAATTELNNSLTQQEIFDRLTDGGLEQGLALEGIQAMGAAGEKKLYLNLDYARFGKMVADFIHGGTLTLGGLDNTSGILQILNGNGDVIGQWTNDGILITAGGINLSRTSGTETIEVHVADDVNTLFKMIYSGAYIQSELTMNGHLIQMQSAAGERVRIWNNEITLSNSDNGVWFIATASGQSPNFSMYGSGYFTGNLTVGGNISCSGALQPAEGSTGTFTTADGKTVTVTHGIITDIS